MQRSFAVAADGGRMVVECG